MVDDFIVGKTFDSFEEVEAFAKTLTTTYFYPLRIKDSKTIEKYNATVSRICSAIQITFILYAYLKIKGPPHDLKWRFKHATFICSHFGEHRDRALGKRLNQHVYACNCPFFFRVVYTPVLQKFRLDSLCVEHKGHPLSSEHIETYRVKE